MCGRTCLTLEPEEIIGACKYKIRKSANNAMNEYLKTEDENSLNKKIIDCYDEYVIPEWRAEFNCGRKYIPSYNIAPTDITPVIISSDHFNDSSSSDERNSRIILPMMWGMIPFWHKGDYRKHGLTTNNCRLEHMLNSKLYRGPFRRGQRCVVLCEGFYEWQTTKSAKPSERAAHLIYMKQNEDTIKIYDRSTWSPNNVNLLKMAGLFDVWEDDNGDKMYSYSIITFESSKILSWMHYRMPAILETETQVNNWLDYKHVTMEEALATLKPATNIQWHQVANIVNNSRNKSDVCNKPIQLSKDKKSITVTSMNKTMLSWLNIRKRREEEIAKINNLSDDDGEKSCDTTTTSESEAENVPKKPRFRDFKRKMLQENTDNEG